MDDVKYAARTEELVNFLEFFRKKFDMPDIAVKRSQKRGNLYSFPVLPDFSKLSELFSGDEVLDFLYNTYKHNKEVIKNFQEQKKDINVKRLLDYLKYMKRQESKEHIYLTRTSQDKKNYLSKLTQLVDALIMVGIDVKNVKYSASIFEKLPNQYTEIKSVERYIKDISCILQNINKGIFPGLFTVHECETCLKFFTNNKIKYFNNDVYSYPIPILRLFPDRSMRISHAVNLNFRAHYIEKIVAKNYFFLRLFLEKKPGVGRKRSDDQSILCAILYKFWENIPWEDVSRVYPAVNASRCQKRKSEWANDGTLRRLYRILRNSSKSRDGKRPGDLRRLTSLVKKVL